VLFQQATLQAGAQNNGNFIGNTLADGQNSTGNNLIAPGYVSPRSYQMNVGVQRQLWKGTILSADYLRNVGLHFLLAYDTNHVGDARFLDTTAATAAISATNSAKGCGTERLPPTSTALSRPAQPSKTTWAKVSTPGTTLPADSRATVPAPSAVSIKPSVKNQMLFPMGRSVYNGLDLKLVSNVDRPIMGIKRLNYQIAYSLSRFDSSAQDQDSSTTPSTSQRQQV